MASGEWPKMFFIVFTMSALFCIAAGQWGYSQDEIEVFDLADEFKGNFYEFLDLSQSASTSEVRRAYRKLSLTMHPDKNKTEGAEENFRMLAAIYEVLKSKEKREIYDNVLAEGIPSAYLYVPKPLRKMTLMEVSIIIALIITSGHYLFLWGSYAEKRLVLEEYLPRLRKKKQRARKKGDEQSAQEIDNLSEQFLQKPGLMDLLPIAIAVGIYKIIKYTPGYIRERREEALALREAERIRKEEEERALEEYKKEQARREEQKTERKRRAKEKKEEMLQYVETSVREEGNFYSPFEVGGTIEDLDDMYGDSEEKKASVRRNEWDINDESTLIKLMTKFPVGSSQRWHRIADEMDKDVSDVIKKAKNIKSNIGMENTVSRQKVKGSDKVDSNMFRELATIRHRVCDEATKSPNVSEMEGDANEQWDSSQQKLFEMALRQFPKGTPARWEKIAKCVPTKTKEDCVARYKQLAEMVQQKKR